MKSTTRDRADVGDPIHSGKPTFAIDGGRGLRRPALPFRTANLSAFFLAVVLALAGCATHQIGPNSSALIGPSRPVGNKETNAPPAKAKAGPKPSAVVAATKTAAPISTAAPIPAVTASRSRKVYVAPVKSAHERAPAPPKATVLNPAGLGSFEKTRLPREEIQDYQSALCLPRDGSIISLRKGMIDFFRKKDVDDPQRADLIEQRGLLQGDMDEFSKLSVNLHCEQN